jgi:hypothetical protein
MIDEMRELYCDIGEGLDLDSPDMPKAGPAELSPPNGTFLVGYRDGVALCGGGVNAFPTAAARSSGCTWCPPPAGRGCTSPRATSRWRTSNGNPVATFFGEKRL